MTEFIFTSQSTEELHKLGMPAARRILHRLSKIKELPLRSPLLKRLHGAEATGFYRLRVGDYRLILSPKEDGRWYIAAVGHRRDIYR